MRQIGWIMSRHPGTGWSDQTNIGGAAFLYLATGEKRYLDKTKQFLDALSAKPPKNTYLTPEWIRAAAMAADWTWNDLSTAERARYGRTLLGLAEWVLQRIWRHSDFNNHFVGEHLSVLYVAVLLDGENIERARTARLMKIGRDYLLAHAVPAANEIAGPGRRRAPDSPVPYGRYLAQPPDATSPEATFVGGQAEGFSYNDWGYARPLALTCEMWRTATGQDLFANSSFFRGQSVWHAYALRPDTGTFARSEDCSSGHRPGENLKQLMHLLAARLKDPLAQWLAQQVRWKYAQKAWIEILFGDPAIPARAPKELALPLAARFAKLGHVYFRSAWSRRDAAFALFQCGPVYAGHQHADNNAFVIHRGGSLAIDSGTNDYGPHRGNYYARTIAHNAVVVFDPAERFSGSAWGGRDGKGSNDGGQLRGPRGITRVGQFRAGCAEDTGRIVAFRTGRYAAGAVGDASRSYSPKKVRRAVRAMLHLRPGDDPTGGGLFVVYDDLATTRADLQARWLLHSIDRPSVSGATFTVARGSGRLSGRILRPERAKIRLVGGPGKESFVNGQNYPPTKNKPDAEHGAWRLEVPFAGQALVVLDARAGAAKAAPAATVRANGDGQVVRIPAGGLEYRIHLGKAPLGRLRVEVYRGADRLEVIELL